MQCPNCNAINRDNSQFCQTCGTPLTSAPARGAGPLAITQRIDSNIPSHPPATPYSAEPSRSMPPLPPASLPYGHPQQPNVMGQSGTASASLWGPFAGYGERRRHISWLLNNQGHREADVNRAVVERFNNRKAQGAALQHTTLTAKGIYVEQRPCFLIQRDITTVALYIARFGQDLYISQATHVKSPLSTTRIGAVIGMALYNLLYPGLLGSRLTSLFNGTGLSLFGGRAPDFPGGLVCFGGPLYLLINVLLTLLIVFTIYKSIADKDPLAALRHRPNEFNQDDTNALEMAVEQTVREVLESLDMKMPLADRPSQSYGGNAQRLL